MSKERYKFFDTEHASRYLSESVIRFDDLPIYVFGVDSRRSAIMFRFVGSVDDERSDMRSISLDDEHVNLMPVPLGFINYTISKRTVPISLCRSPARQWKWGLTTKTLLVATPDDIAYSKPSILISEGLKRCVLNEYPAYLDARAASSKGIGSAFSRHFAIYGEGHHLLYYRFPHYPVGTAHPDGVRLKKEFFYLMQALEMEGARCLTS